MSYARGTLAALVDALVPETPELADRGEEHVPGGLAVDLEDHLVEAFDDLQAVEEGSLLDLLGHETVPLATVVAGLLDVAALELVVRRDAEEPLRSPREAFSRGPFSRLSRRDRLRAVRLLEEDGVLADAGGVNYLAQAVVTVTEMAYYSDWVAEQGWEQADYPGPADGYAALLGYEVDEFEEDDY